MPHCIAKGCMNRDNKCPKGFIFHFLPRKNPSLLHQASFCCAYRLVYVSIKCWDNIDHSFQWFLVLHLTDVSINDANARICSDHFIREDYIQPVSSGFGPSKPTLKPDAVPSVRTSRGHRAGHRAVPSVRTSRGHRAGGIELFLQYVRAGGIEQGACWDNIDHSFQWFLVLHLTDVSINDANARICSDHFIWEDYIQPVISGFGHSKPTLKPDRCCSFSMCVA